MKEIIPKQYMIRKDDNLLCRFTVEDWKSNKKEGERAMPSYENHLVILRRCKEFVLFTKLCK